MQHLASESALRCACRLTPGAMAWPELAPFQGCGNYVWLVILLERCALPPHGTGSSIVPELPFPWAQQAS